jgi:type II secretory pathway component GspD/PulD (secretin)
VCQRTHKKFVVDPRVVATVNLDGVTAREVTIVTTIVVVKNMRAPELVTVIRPLMAPNSQVNALADRNALIIVDKAANVRRMVTIIRELDTMPVFKAE